MFLTCESYLKKYKILKKKKLELVLFFFLNNPCCYE